MREVENLSHTKWELDFTRFIGPARYCSRFLPSPTGGHKSENPWHFSARSPTPPCRRKPRAAGARSFPGRRTTPPVRADAAYKAGVSSGSLSIRQIKNLVDTRISVNGRGHGYSNRRMASPLQYTSPQMLPPKIAMPHLSPRVFYAAATKLPLRWQSYSNTAQSQTAGPTGGSDRSPCADSQGRFW